jgi:hypothetical protein
MLIKEIYNNIINFFNDAYDIIVKKINNNYISKKLKQNKNYNNNNNNNNKDNKNKKFLIFLLYFFLLIILFIILFYLIKIYYPSLFEIFYEADKFLGKTKEEWLKWVLDLIGLILINIPSYLALFCNSKLNFFLGNEDNEDTDLNINEEDSISPPNQIENLDDSNQSILLMNNDDWDSDSGEQSDTDYQRARRKGKQPATDFMADEMEDPTEKIPTPELLQTMASIQKEIDADAEAKRLAEPRTKLGYNVPGLDLNQLNSKKLLIGHMQDALIKRDINEEEIQSALEQIKIANAKAEAEAEAGPSKIIDKQPKEVHLRVGDGNKTHRVYQKLPDDDPIKGNIVQPHQENQTDGVDSNENKKCSWWCFWK